MTRQFSCAFVIFVLGLFSSLTLAFDIAVYGDARSGVNYRSQYRDSSFCEVVDRTTVLDRINPANEQQVFDWFWEMGADYVITWYPFYDDFTNLLALDPDLKILNFAWPGQTSVANVRESC